MNGHTIWWFYSATCFCPENPTQGSISTPASESCNIHHPHREREREGEERYYRHEKTERDRKMREKRETKREKENGRSDETQEVEMCLKLNYCPIKS